MLFQPSARLLAAAFALAVVAGLSGGATTAVATTVAPAVVEPSVVEPSVAEPASTAETVPASVCGPVAERRAGTKDGVTVVIQSGGRVSVIAGDVRLERTPSPVLPMTQSLWTPTC